MDLFNPLIFEPLARVKGASDPQFIEKLSQDELSCPILVKEASKVVVLSHDHVLFPQREGLASASQVKPFDCRKEVHHVELIIVVSLYESREDARFHNNVMLSLEKGDELPPMDPEARILSQSCESAPIVEAFIELYLHHVAAFSIHAAFFAIIPTIEELP